MCVLVRVLRILGRWAGEAAEMQQGREGKPGTFGTVERKLGGSLDSLSL